MPTHDFRCNKCLYVWEEFWHITEYDSNMEKINNKEWKCPNCGSNDIIKFVNAPAIVFKGVPGQSGFYSLDYPNKKAISDTQQ
jgi:putative FmdB family regulatory protein